MAVGAKVPESGVTEAIREGDIDKLMEEAEELERRVGILSGNISGIEGKLKRPDLEGQKRKGLEYNLAKARQKMQKMQERQGQLMDYTRI